MKNVPFFGRGGGSSSGSPTITPDTAKSRDTIEFVLGMGEGVFQGPKFGLKSFYINNVQLQNDDDSFNFTAFALYFNPGTPAGEEIVLRLGGAASSHAVGVQLSDSDPIVQTTITRGINMINIRILFTQVYSQDSKGNVNATGVHFRIEYKQHSSSTWINPYGNDIYLNNVKFTQSYIKEMQFNVAPITTDDYDIRITKLDGVDDTMTFRDYSWDSYQEIISEPLIFPNTATIHGIGEATNQLSSIPNFSTDMLCRIIKVPDNYNPETGEYTGTWDGTWVAAYSNNPAFVLYDFITDDVQGLASYASINIDPYDIYMAGQFCSAQIPRLPGNPDTTYRPRYTTNLTIQEPQSGIDMCRYLAGIFNAVIFDQLDGNVRLIFDDPTAPANHMVGKQDIIGKFSYSFTDITSRYNDITVTFINPALQWQEDRRRVYNQDLIDTYGRVPLDFVAIGCIDPDEAVSRAQYKLLSATTEVQQVTFKRHRISETMQPWEIVLISDDDMGYGISGRILSQSGNTVTLRDPVFLENGVTYQFQANIPNPDYFDPWTNPSGASVDPILVITATVINTTIGSVKTLVLDSIPTLPEYASFTLNQPVGSGIGVPKAFRILSIDEDPENPEQYTVTCSEVNRNKQAIADGVVATAATILSYTSGVSGPVSNITIKETTYNVGSVSSAYITATWDFSTTPLVTSYQVTYTDPTGATVVMPPTTQNSVQINPSIPGNYTFSVVANSSSGSTSASSSATYTAKCPAKLEPLFNSIGQAVSMAGQVMYVNTAN